MTRFLSESLQAPEPHFRHGIEHLERANGRPAADIRLTTEVLQAARLKLHALGLDGHDTTGKELYHALQERFKADDAALVKTLRTRAATYISADGDTVAGMAHALQTVPMSKRCFALKTSRLKTLLKKQPPKKTMKLLGYRSLDSMLKHEAVASVLAAATITESPAWRRSLLDQYKHLKASDFEMRTLTILHPSGRRWQTLAAQTVQQARHNLLSFPELGTLILLPLPKDMPAGATTASLVLALHALNDLRASSSFLKLGQVRKDFGSLVQTVAVSEPYLRSRLLDQPISWHLIQRFYTRARQFFQAELFEPHIELHDMLWQPIEEVLSQIEPRLAFWHGSAHLGILHERQPVSLNIVDAALNSCNSLPYERRVAHYFQTSLWHELLLRYLQPETVEQSILQELQPQLAAEAAIAD